MVTRYSTCLRTGKTSVESQIFITSIEPGDKTPAQLAALVRGQWSIENKNHWKRDTSRWREDRGPRRHPNGTKNLGLMRGALLALIPLAEFDSLNAALDHYASHPWQALALPTQKPLPSKISHSIALLEPLTERSEERLKKTPEESEWDDRKIENRKGRLKKV
jgi:hypothetical protein